MAVTRAGAPLEPERLRRTIDDTLASAAVGAPPTWTLPDHVDTRRARAVLLLLLALPGSVVLHQGEEPGLEEAGDAHVHNPGQEPDSMPAFLAGESSLKSWTSTPRMSGKPTYSASFAVAF